MRESVVVNRWIAEGRVEGRAEGLAEGEAKGEAKGEARGQLTERAASLLDMLHDKFGQVPEDLAGAIHACTDLAKLRQWMTLAVRADTLDAFRASLGATP